jgi:hypothetical protein
MRIATCDVRPNGPTVRRRTVGPLGRHAPSFRPVPRAAPGAERTAGPSARSFGVRRFFAAFHTAWRCHRRDEAEAARHRDFRTARRPPLRGETGYAGYWAFRRMKSGEGSPHSKGAALRRSAQRFFGEPLARWAGTRLPFAPYPGRCPGLREGLGLRPAALECGAGTMLLRTDRRRGMIPALPNRNRGTRSRRWAL